MGSHENPTGVETGKNPSPEEKATYESPQGKEKTSVDYQKAIGSLVESIKDGKKVRQDIEGAERLPDANEIRNIIKNIHASQFLVRSPEDLREIFLVDGAVDFYFHPGCKRNIGMGDLFSGKDQYISLNGEVVKRSAKNGKVGYLTSTGAYAPIFGGEKVEQNPSNQAIQAYESASEGKINTYSEEDEVELKLKFKEKVAKEEKTTEEVMHAFLQENPDFKDILNIKEDQALTEKAEQFASAIENMSATEFIALRNKVGGDKLRELMEMMGLAQKNETAKLAGSVKGIVDSIPQSGDMARLVATFGGKLEFKNLLMKLSEHETGGKMSPYNWSGTNCMGYFHFNFANTKHYQKNPCNPEAAVEGVIALMVDNMKSLGEKATPGLILAAHNAGVGNVLKPDKYKPVHGNPSLTRFAEMVTAETKDYRNSLEASA